MLRNNSVIINIDLSSVCTHREYISIEYDKITKFQVFYENGNKYLKKN